jgi:hypothetical protein
MKDTTITNVNDVFTDSEKQAFLEKVAAGLSPDMAREVVFRQRTFDAKNAGKKVGK